MRLSAGCVGCPGNDDVTNDNEMINSIYTFHGTYLWELGLIKKQEKFHLIILS